MRGFGEGCAAFWVLSVLVFLFALIAATANGVPADTIGGQVFRALSNPMSAEVNTFIAAWAGIASIPLFVGMVIGLTVADKQDRARKGSRFCTRCNASH